jgi:hypothetical protein
MMKKVLIILTLGFAVLASSNASSTLTKTQPPVLDESSDRLSVLTQLNENGRSGAYLNESVLTPNQIKSRGMRLKYQRPLDAELQVQPLYVHGLMINGVKRNVVYVATLHTPWDPQSGGNTVYAYDADNENSSGTDAGLIWKKTLTDPEQPQRRPLALGVRATPVIDPTSNTIYLSYGTQSKYPIAGNVADYETDDVEYWLVALDIRDGRVLRGPVKVTGRVLRSDGTPCDFVARYHWNRPALLLSNGSVYVAFGAVNADYSPEGSKEYHGWVMRYDAQTLSQKAVFNTTPDNRGPKPGQPIEGGGVWQSGSGLAADPSGNVYFITGNAKADARHRWYGDSIVKLKGDTLSPEGSYTPPNPQIMEELDIDLGSAGPMLIPGTRFLVGGGKPGSIYLLDSINMRELQRFVAFTNVCIRQDAQGKCIITDSQGVERHLTPEELRTFDGMSGPHMHGAAPYWRGPNQGFGYIYSWAEKEYLKAYKYDPAQNRFIDVNHPLKGTILADSGLMPGGMLSISANGNSPGTGVLWATTPVKIPNQNFAWLIAFDAETLNILWKTGKRDETDPAKVTKWDEQTDLPDETSRFQPVTVADGKVFVGTLTHGLWVYELGPSVP